MQLICGPVLLAGINKLFQKFLNRDNENQHTEDDQREENQNQEVSDKRAHSGTEGHRTRVVREESAGARRDSQGREVVRGEFVTAQPAELEGTDPAGHMVATSVFVD